MADIRTQQDGAVLVLTIDRPHARNALAPSTMAELDALLAGLAAREDVRCAVLTGAGDRAFIAGGDLRELESGRDEAFGRWLARDMRAALDRIPALPVPVIAALNGVAVGGGAEVAVACDFRIAAEDASIGFTQALLGVMPAWGGIERLGGLVGRGRALYLLTSGRVLSGAEAAAWGLVEEAVPRERFDARWRELAQAVASAPRHVLAAMKAATNAAHPGSRPDLAEPAIASFARAWAHEDHWRMAEAMEQRRRASRSRT
jgi:enoyl-CoA hydratase/carnithine racemase